MKYEKNLKKFYCDDIKEKLYLNILNIIRWLIYIFLIF